MDASEDAASSQVEKIAAFERDIRLEFTKMVGEACNTACREICKDLDEVHMKQDVTKQELNYAQSAIVDQQNALEGLQESSRQGFASMSTMVHVLRDDVVGFKE